MSKIKAVLKTKLEIGSGIDFDVPNRNVVIIDSENHVIYGKRYKVFGYEEWFEENAFEYIESEDK